MCELRVPADWDSISVEECYLERSWKGTLLHVQWVNSSGLFWDSGGGRNVVSFLIGCGKELEKPEDNWSLFEGAGCDMQDVPV